MGSRAGVLKVAAKRTGLSVEEYAARIDAGEKWCTRCKAWHPRSAFHSDRSRGDGLKASCRKWTSPRGNRDPQKEKARAKVEAAVRYKKIAHPNDLPCYDCGHVWSEGERRHEYDHHKGYERENWLNVQPVCTLCHADREKAKEGPDG